ncbi:phosphoglycerate mutase-like protein [Zalerion maritima]|uniref:Phosphoglycerate mutase-like protein n=1 Tax=Zalerion maritima TaxID=339359 RepID=A0AAD5WUB3_9PEZI|nr:phosphoglycerate mutase-like protein [Zalerion maritima]
MPPALVLIRHAQALHNVNKEYDIPDPVLSELGEKQCIDLREKLKTVLPTVGKVDLIMSSPMRRTLQTAKLGLNWLIESGLKIEANADWQENSAKPCDTGTNVSELAKDFPNVNFDNVDPVYPDKTSPAGARYAHSKKAITTRAQLALEHLYSRPEKVIVVVSHSGFLRQGMTGFWFFNADFRIFDFEERKKETNGPYKLKQWDLTTKGGLGWSWTDPVEVGDGLPEDEGIPEADRKLPE